MRALTWRAAVVAVVVLVAGACGNADGGGGSGDDGGGRPKLPLGAVGSSRSATSAMSSSEAASDGSASMIAPRRTVEYRVADDAKSVPETATAYEVKARPADEVRAKVAKALDVDPDRIEVGMGGYDWYYSGNVSPDSAVSSSAVSPACAPDEKCIEPSFSPPPTVRGVPSAADAEDRVRKLLESLDVSTKDGRFETFGEDGYNRTVRFTPTVDGLAVAGLQTQIAFGADARIEYANGMLADVESIGEYPLVGLAEAVKRLETGFGSGGVRTMGAPEPAIDVASDPAATSEGAAESSGNVSGGSSGSAGSGSVEEVPPTCVEGEPCTSPPSPPKDEPTMTIEPQPMPPELLEPEIVEITGAEVSLQLVMAGCPGDPVYLVPTFDLLPGPVASIIAVEDDAISGDPAVGDPGFEPCPDQGPTDVPLGKPEPAPMPADAGREPAKP